MVSGVTDVHVGGTGRLSLHYVCNYVKYDVIGEHKGVVHDVDSGVGGERSV